MKRTDMKHRKITERMKKNIEGSSEEFLLITWFTKQLQHYTL
jgi:hypothetical protein